MRRPLAETSWMLSAAIAVLTVVVGCGGEGSSMAVTHDLAALHLGVDVDAEADAVADNLVSRGFVVGVSATGAGYRAFDAAHGDGRTLVRVITRAGIAIALDVPAEDRDAPVSLAVAAGIPDVIVRRRDPEADRACFALLRADADGRIRPVPIALEAFGPGACVERIRDLDGDDRPELLTRSSPSYPFGSRRATIPGVFVESAGAYRPAAAGELAAYWAAEEQRRQADVRSARRALDVDSALRLAAELALLARQRGDAVAVQVAAFDAALSGLVLSEAEAQAVTASRRHIADGWPE